MLFSEMHQCLRWKFHFHYLSIRSNCYLINENWTYFIWFLWISIQTAMADKRWWCRSHWFESWQNLGQVSSLNRNSEKQHNIYRSNSILMASKKWIEWFLMAIMKSSVLGTKQNPRASIKNYPIYSIRWI